MSIFTPPLLRYLNSLKRHARIIFYFAKTHAPLQIYIGYVSQLFQRKAILNAYGKEQHNYRATKEKLRISNDWFTKNIPFWLSVMDEYALRNKELKALEIGSWEGLSSHFILSSLAKAHLTCVDTWEGADEQKVGTSKETLSQIEKNFDENLMPYIERLEKYKGTSFSFFLNNTNCCVYDFIYVDGSHHCDDVMIDAVKCFEMLKIGGIMVFDDYLWQHYTKAADNPATAINLFLRLKKNSYRIIQVNYQVTIMKLKDRY
jgi:predicted O-methyltransferase YrrM